MIDDPEQLELDDDRANLNHFSFTLRHGVMFPFKEGDEIHIELRSSD